jgi:hypothetical protein
MNGLHGRPDVGLVYGVLCHFRQYFSVIGGGNHFSTGYTQY